MELQQDTFLLPIPHGKRVRTVLHPSMKQSEAEQWFRSEPAERARQVAGLQAVFRRDAAVAGAARAAPKHRVLHESGRLAPCQRHGARPACVLVVRRPRRRRHRAPHIQAHPRHRLRQGASSAQASTPVSLLPGYEEASCFCNGPGRIRHWQGRGCTVRRKFVEPACPGGLLNYPSCQTQAKCLRMCGRRARTRRA